MAGKRTNKAKLNGTLRGKGESPAKGNAGQGNGGRGSGDGGDNGGNGTVGNLNTSEKVKPPDAMVTKAENESVGLRSLSLKETPFPRRPAYGSQERDNLILRTNYFNILLCNKHLLLYRYDLSMVPEEPQPRRRRRIVELLIKEGVFKEQKIPVDKIATDWRSIIISTKALDFGTEEKIVGGVQYYEAEETGPPNLNATVGSRNNPIVTIHKGEVLTVQDLIDFLTSVDGRAQDENNKNIVHALNIVISRYPSITSGVTIYSSNNRYFPPQPIAPLAHLTGGLVALCGFYSSVRTATSRLLLNVNSITAAFYQPCMLRDLMESYISSPRPQGWEARMMRFLKGLRVELVHLPVKTKDGKSDNGSFKKKVIFGFGTIEKPFTTARQHSFMYAKNAQQTERRITVVDYFKEKYNRTVNWPNDILINVGNGANPVLIPQEFCKVLPGQPAKSKLSSAQTPKMVLFAARAPPKNEGLIRNEGARVLGLADANGPASFGLTVVPEMITVHGRRLAPPFVTYLNGIKFQPTNGTWNLATRDSVYKFSVAKELENWTYVYIHWGNEKIDWEGPLEGKIELLKEAMMKYGLIVRKHFALPEHVFSLNKHSDYEPILERQLKMIQERRSREMDDKRQQGKLKFLFVIMPEKNTRLYNAIKKSADTVLGFHTSCMLPDKVKKASSQYFANVAMKVNLKLGGSNQLAMPSSLGILKQAGTMVLGIDVTHPSPGSDVSAPSIAACVANTDITCGQWLGSIDVQGSRVEMVKGLPAMVRGRIEIWKKHNPTLPKRIIVYRDGVSEDQYSMVLQEEWNPETMGELVFKKLYGHSKNWPKISIIVVGKRHHTRFFATREEDKSVTGNMNPKNGLVVDRGVTSKHMWDFFLQPQDSPKGTARPIHYIVIKDENRMDVDGLEKMTHSLCYLWGRATKSVAVCPPAFYADILCTRARCYLGNVFGDAASEGGSQAGAAWQWNPVHPDIKDKMFFV